MTREVRHVVRSVRDCIHAEGKAENRLGQWEIVYTLRESQKNRLGLGEDLFEWRET